jgi:hypothetical protein
MYPELEAAKNLAVRTGAILFEHYHQPTLSSEQGFVRSQTLGVRPVLSLSAH